MRTAKLHTQQRGGLSHVLCLLYARLCPLLLLLRPLVLHCPRPAHAPPATVAARCRGGGRRVDRTVMTASLIASSPSFSASSFAWLQTPRTGWRQRADIGTDHTTRADDSALEGKRALHQDTTHSHRPGTLAGRAPAAAGERAAGRGRGASTLLCPTPPLCWLLFTKICTFLSSLLVPAHPCCQHGRGSTCVCAWAADGGQPSPENLRHQLLHRVLLRVEAPAARDLKAENRGD